MSKPEKYLYGFGAFRLNTIERLLLRDDQPIALTLKVFDILLVLVKNSGRLLEKDELLKQVWPSQFVEEGDLPLNISLLRKALGENRTTHRYIETVPKRGYRFVAEVRELRVDGVVKTGVGRRVIFAEEETSSKAQAIDSLAVLPFVNVSADPNSEYLADGITESIINNLSQLSGLRVMARNSVFRYKGTEANAQEVGQELNVGAVLLGRVLLFGEQLIIRAELVDVADGSQLWGERYNRKPSDILAVQKEIAKEISEKLQLSLTNKVKSLLRKGYTENIEAYQAYLRGQYFWNKRMDDWFKKALEYFQQAIGIDPSYALAYVGLAD